MKLFTSPGACSMAPHIVLIELGLKHSVEFVDIRAQPHVLKKDGVEYTTVNPKGAVPALMLDSGEILTENAVILQYLADQKPDSALLPKSGTMERYHALEWLNFIATDVHKTLGHLFNPQMPEDGKAALKQTADRRFKHLDGHLGKKLFLTGDFSVADAYLWVLLSWMPVLKIDITPYTNLKKFQERVGSRPSVVAMLKAEGLA